MNNNKIQILKMCLSLKFDLTFCHISQGPPRTIVVYIQHIIITIYQ